MALAVKAQLPSTPLGHFWGAGVLPCVPGQCSQEVDLRGSWYNPDSSLRPPNLAGAWECVCFTCGWSILVRSPFLQQGVMASVRADGVRAYVWPRRPASVRGGHIRQCAENSGGERKNQGSKKGLEERKKNLAV